MALNPGIQSRRGMSKTQLWMPLHELQSRSKRSLSGLPSVRHRPEPGEIEMGMPNPMNPSQCRRTGTQQSSHSGPGIRRSRIHLSPGSWQVTTGLEMQHQRFRE